MSCSPGTGNRPAGLPRDPISRLLLAALPPRHLADAIEGDLAEEMALDGHSRAWLWSQLFRSAPRLIRLQITRDAGARERLSLALILVAASAVLSVLGRIVLLDAASIGLVASAVIALACCQLVSRPALQHTGLLLGSLLLAAAIFAVGPAAEARGFDRDTSVYMLYAMWSIPAMNLSVLGRRGCGRRSGPPLDPRARAGGA